MATDAAATASIESGRDSDADEGAMLAPGTRVDRYVILECIGAGGMGVVYAAFDPNLRRKVAIKLLARDRRASLLARMLREAEGLAQLSHPNVVAVYDSGLYRGGLFIAMEFVDGVPLSTWQAMKERSSEQIVDAYISAGRGLAAAHAAGMVHRDFKPDNVLVGNDGRVRVIDFGLVKAGDTQVSVEESSPKLQNPATFEPMDGLRRSEAVTHVGARMGTPKYMSPEQHLGVRADARSDQFSFCVSLHEALTGQSPFDYKAFIGATKRGDTPSAPEVRTDGLPRNVARAIARGLALEPTGRFADIDELLHELGLSPKRRVGGWVLGAVGAMLVASLAVYGSGESPLKQCRSRAVTVASEWSELTRERLAAQFRRVAGEYGAETFARLDRRMLSTIDALRSDHHAACEATYRDYTQSAVQLDARMSCLSRRQKRVGLLVHAWEQPDRKSVDHALQALERVTSQAGCGGAEAMSMQSEANRVKPEIWDRYQSALDQGIAQSALGNAQGALDAVAPFVDQIPSELPRLKARFNLEAGVALKRLSRVTEAFPRLGTAREFAIRGGDEATASDALLDLADAHMFAGHHSAAEALLLTHRARVVGVPERARSALFYHQLLGRLNEDLGRMDDAEREHEAGMQLAMRSLGPLELARAKAYLGVLRAEQGRFSDALLLTREAYQESRERLGEENPGTITWRTYYAQALGSLGRYREALTHFRAILEIDLDRFGETHNDVALDRAYIAEAEQALGNVDEALEQRVEAHRIFRALFGETHVHAASELALVAQLYALVGRSEEARATFARALELLESSEAGEGYAIDAFTASARFHLAAQRADEARAAVARAVELSTKHYGDQHITTARTLAIMSDVRLAQNQLEDAHVWAQRARDALPADGSPPVEEQAAVWLALGRTTQQRPGAPIELRLQIADALSALIPALRSSEVLEAHKLLEEVESLSAALGSAS